MEYLESSFFIALLIRFWDWVTVLFRGSVLYRFCMWCWAAFKNGPICHFCIGGTFADGLWTHSQVYRGVLWLINLPSRFISWLYGKIRPAADESYACRAVLGVSERYTSAYLGLTMLVILIIPQKRWDNVYSLMAALLALLFFIASGARNERFRFSLREIGFFPVMFAFCVFLGFATSQQMGLSLRFLVFGITCMIIVLVLVGSVKSPGNLHTIVALCSIGLFVCAAYALVQRITGVAANGILTDLDLNADMPGRVYSFFENPNSFANILVLFTPMMLTMALYTPGGGKKLWYLTVFGLCCMALLMTYSRGGWLSLAFGLGILLLALGPRWVPFCMVICVLALPFLPDNILNRLLTIFNTADSSIYTREYIYSAMGRLIALYPIFGAGLGATALKHAINATGVYEAKALFIHGHNIYLQIWGEMGVFALIAFLGSMAFAVRGGLQLRRESDPIIRAVAVGASCGLCGSLFFGITDYAWSYPRVMVIFWFVFALIPAAMHIKNIKEAGKING
ncbi:MAG: O-antigen ligase family protein [Oscillospiraceae bacterium]